MTMTDTEREALNRFMAEKVMGWEVQEAGEGRLYRYYLDSQGTVTRYTIGEWTPSPWSPTTDPRAANAVMERFTEERTDPADRTRGWRVALYSYNHGKRWLCLLKNVDGYIDHDVSSAKAPTWMEALCLAAKKAWEEKP